LLGKGGIDRGGGLMMTRCFDLDNIITVLLKKIKKDDKKKVKKIYYIIQS